MECYHWSCTAGEDFLQNNILFDSSYNKLSASFVVWKNVSSHKVKDSETADHHHLSTMIQTSFVGYGGQYAHSKPSRPAAATLFSTLCTC